MLVDQYIDSGLTKADLETLVDVFMCVLESEVLAERNQTHRQEEQLNSSLHDDEEQDIARAVIDALGNLLQVWLYTKFDVVLI